MLRLNTNRLTHTARQALQRLPFHLPIHKLRSLFVAGTLLLLVLQFFVLSTPSSLSYYDDKEDKVFVVDKTMATSAHYRHLLSKFSEKFPGWTKQQKCQAYFDELYSIDEDWEVLPPKANPDDYKKEIFDHDKYIQSKVTDYKKENGADPSDGKKAEFELDFQKMVESTATTEQVMIDAVTHLRVFGECFLKDQQTSAFSKLFGSGNQASDTDIDMCYDVEHRLFPWLSRELPSFTRWDGTTVRGIPRMSNYIDITDYEDQDMPLSLDEELAIKAAQSLEDASKQNSGTNAFGNGAKLFKRASPARTQCFMNQWRSALNGRGLVLSVADKYEDDLKGLLRVLRALNNKLPIQLVHKGDLSEKVQKALVEVARSDEVDVPLEVYSLIKNDVPHNFPKQELWFVNAKRCIEKDYQNKFNGFSNKLIAYLFASFDEIMLMDTDSIPLVKPSTFFNLGPYQRTQALFFKDRFNAEKVAKHDSDFFAKLMPSSIDEVLFDVPRVSNLTLENRYMKNQFRHFMEAGVVAIKRSNHFIGILTSIQMNFWGATSSRIWGDKELFWLGQSASGNENYEFNKYDVVSVGELTPMSDRPRNTIAHELCSTHPGHLSGDDDYTLLWINSGMRYCKVNTWEKDFKDQDRIKKAFENVLEVEKFYKAPLKINAALIPPGGDRIKSNDKNEPAKGWVMNGVCGGYLWCAYDIIGASTDPLDRGAYVEYNNVTEFRNYYLGKLWLQQDLVPISEYDLKMIEYQKEQAMEKAKKQREKEENEKKEKDEQEKKEKEEKEKKEREEKEKKEKEEKEKKDKEEKEKEEKDKADKEREEKEKAEKETQEQQAQDAAQEDVTDQDIKEPEGLIKAGSDIRLDR